MTGTSMDGLDVAVLETGSATPASSRRPPLPLAKQLAEALVALCGPGDDGIDRLGASTPPLRVHRPIRARLPGKLGHRGHRCARHRFPRADRAAPPGRQAAVHPANRRSQPDRRGHRHRHRRRLPPPRHGRRWPGSAARAAVSRGAVPPPCPPPRGPQHRRHCQRNDAACGHDPGHRIRHRTRQRAARCVDTASPR